MMLTYTAVVIGAMNAVASIGMFLIHCAREKREIENLQRQIDSMKGIS